MTTFVAILIAVWVWCFQALVASGINGVRGSRLPESVVDFMKLTFAPYVIYCVLFDSEALD